jgi:peptidoglycan/LPS O-acetylase OafA/YrhL
MYSKTHNASSRISTLDLARGLAALAVCAGHLRAAIFVDFGQLESSTLVQKVFYAMTSLGHEAVMIFFVLSGYLVGGSILKQKHKFEWLKYSITRLTRLWVVLIPALLLTLIVDQTILLFHPEVFAGANSEMWASGPDKSNYSSSISALIGNMFFQQTVFVPIYGTNSPLWSLSNEFYYYLIFPALMLLIGYIGQLNNLGLRLFLGFGGVIILFLLPSGFAAGFLVFCMGALVSWFNGRVTGYKVHGIYQMLIGCAAFLFALYLSKANLTLRFISHDILVGFGFSLFLVSFAKVQIRLILLRRSAAFIADISYSLYLTHFPVVLLIAVTCYGTNQVKPDAIGISQFIGWLGSVLLIAVFFWWLFERYTDSIGHKVMALVARRKECLRGNE